MFQHICGLQKCTLLTCISQLGQKTPLSEQWNRNEDLQCFYSHLQKVGFMLPTFFRWKGLSSQKLYSLPHPPKIAPEYKNVQIFPEDLQHSWLSRNIPHSSAVVGRSMAMAVVKAVDQWAAWSAGCSRHLRALGLGPWQPPPSLLMWACTKIELGMLVALMLWLPRGLQLPLCPISVMDELHLISASPPSIYVGPWLAAWPPSKGEGGGHQTSGTLSENSAGEGESHRFFQEVRPQRHAGVRL